MDNKTSLEGLLEREHQLRLTCLREIVVHGSSKNWRAKDRAPDGKSIEYFAERFKKIGIRLKLQPGRNRLEHLNPFMYY
jgi:hypothetical protein